MRQRHGIEHPMRSQEVARRLSEVRTESLGEVNGMHAQIAREILKAKRAMGTARNGLPCSIEPRGHGPAPDRQRPLDDLGDALAKARVAAPRPADEGAHEALASLAKVVTHHPIAS